MNKHRSFSERLQVSMKPIWTHVISFTLRASSYLFVSKIRKLHILLPLVQFFAGNVPPTMDRRGNSHADNVRGIPVWLLFLPNSCYDKHCLSTCWTLNWWLEVCQCFFRKAAVVPSSLSATFLRSANDTPFSRIPARQKAESRSTGTCVPGSTALRTS